MTERPPSNLERRKDRLTLNRSAIAISVASKCGVTQTEAKELLDQLLEEISKSLAKGCDVKLARFGSFKIRLKTERPGRNPKTLEPALIKSRRSISFKPSDVLKNLVQQ